MKIAESELVLNSDGTIYHLAISKDDIADTIILVGDPERVKLVSSFFDVVTFTHSNREMNIHTGTYNGKPISVMSTGMGIGCIDIVVSELDALANIDLKTSTVNEKHRKLQLIRIGTCGVLDENIPVGSFIAGKFALGLDGLLHSYVAHEKSEACQAIEQKVVKELDWHSPKAAPYCFESSQSLLEKVAFDMVQGITVTAAGFFGPQGRTLRAQCETADLPEQLARKVGATNLEMECAPLYGLASILGHDALTVCLGVANRAKKEFLQDYHGKMKQLIETILIRL